MRVSEKQIALLAPYLEGNQPTHTNVDRETGEETREWNLICPLHEDGKRSASINVDKGLFHCFVCGGMPVSRLVRRKDEWHAAPHLNGHSNGKLNLQGQPNKRQRTLTEGHIGGWHSALLSNEGALRWLLERRGIDMRTVEEYEIGIDHNGLYTIPVRSDEGEIWNVRFYNRNPGSDRRKIWNEPGYGAPARLYPMSVLEADPDEIVICEGEWDALLANQFGYPAITRTSAADVWMAEWGEHFKGKVV